MVVLTKSGYSPRKNTCQKTPSQVGSGVPHKQIELVDPNQTSPDTLRLRNLLGELN